MLTLVEQLRAAFERSGLSMAELATLCAKQGFHLHPSTLRRKLIGDGRKGRRRTGLRTEECEAIASVLGITLAVIPEETKEEAKAS